MMGQLNLFETGQKCQCGRCGALIKVDPLAGSKAKMLKRSAVPKGLCLNCAVHDFLRNTYPVNLLLARSGPRCLALPHIQEQFAGIMQSQFSDAAADEIDWQTIVENWDLPFPNKLKRSSMNPVDQAELDRHPEEDKRRREIIDEQIRDPRSPEEKVEANCKRAGELLLNVMRKRNENTQTDNS